MRKTLIPCDLLHGTVCLAYLWKGRCLYHGLLSVQGKPLDAAEPVIDRIPLGGQHLHDPPILHVKIHVAVQGTVVAGLYLFHAFLTPSPLIFDPAPVNPLLKFSQVRQGHVLKGPLLKLLKPGPVHDVPDMFLAAGRLRVNVFLHILIGVFDDF